MAKWWSPVIVLNALDAVLVTDVFTYFKTPPDTGTPNPRPNVDCKLTNYDTYRGETDRLLLVIQGYYDDGWNTARDTQDPSRVGMYRKLTYTSIAGDPGNESTGAIEHTAAGAIFQNDIYVVRPNAPEIHETSVYFPFLIYSVEFFDTISATYGSNGMASGAAEYTSQSEAHGAPGDSGPQPASQNTIRDYAIWWDEEVLDPGGDDYIDANQYFHGPSDSPVSSLTGGRDSELNGGPPGWTISGDARFHNTDYFADEAGHSSTFAMDSSYIPIFARMKPGDGVPVAGLLLGWNYDGHEDYSGDPIGTSVLTRLQMSWKFGKVDRVWTTVPGNNAEDTAVLPGFNKVT